MADLNIDPFSRNRSTTPAKQVMNFSEPIDIEAEARVIVPEPAKETAFDPKPAFTIPGKDKTTAEKELEVSKKSLNFSRNLQLAKAGIGILNANMEFNQIKSTARNNIMLANHQFGEAISIGKQNALREETKGFAKGENALLSAVAQGQSVQGGIAQSSQLAEETLGVLNAVQVEVNSVKRAYGFAQEANLIQHETNLAELNRNAAVVTSALSGAIALI